MNKPVEIITRPPVGMPSSEQDNKAFRYETVEEAYHDLCAWSERALLNILSARDGKQSLCPDAIRAEVKRLKDAASA